MPDIVGWLMKKLVCSWCGHIGALHNWNVCEACGTDLSNEKAE